MSTNKRIQQQTELIISLQEGTAEHEIEKERYWQIFEEEIKKDPFSGWIGHEDPLDVLIDAVDSGDVDRIAWILPEVIRFKEIVERARGPRYQLSPMHDEYIKIGQRLVAA